MGDCGGKRNKQMNTISGAENPQIDDKNIWICLAKIHEKLGDVDTVKGLWRRIASENVRKAFDLQSSGDIKSSLAIFNESIGEEQNPDVREEIHK